MSWALVLRATVVLGLSAGLLAGLRRQSATVRHGICVATVAVLLALPLLLVLHAPAITMGSLVRLPVSAASASGASWPRFFAWTRTIWLAGLMCCALRFALGASYLAWKTQASAGEGRVRFGAVASPLVWGWFRPTILMPVAAAQWNEERWRLALAHEESHVRRGDVWTSTLAAAAAAMYWFHPLVWWVTRRLQLEAELACDEAVLEAGNDGLAYAGLLLAAARGQAPGFLGCRMTGGQMKKRIQRILDWRPAASGLRGKQWRVMAAGAALLLAGALVNPARAGEGTDHSPAPHLGSEFTKPELITKVEPEYTPEAKKAKVHGAVLLSVTIAETGAVSVDQLLRGLDAGLDQQAITAVSLWKFRPATKDGKPVAVQANVEVDFRLVDDPEKK